jgi:hypothetical protein
VGFNGTDLTGCPALSARPLASVPVLGYLHRTMKPFLSFLFFLISTIVLATGLWMSVDKGASWLLLVGVLGYLGLFVKYGCQGH